MVLLEAPGSCLAPWPTVGLPGDPRGRPRVGARTRQPSSQHLPGRATARTGRWRGCSCLWCFSCRFSRGFSLKGLCFGFRPLILLIQRIFASQETSFLRRTRADQLIYCSETSKCCIWYDYGKWTGPNLTSLLWVVLVRSWAAEDVDWSLCIMKGWAFDTSVWKGRKKEANSVLQYTQF